LADHALHLAVVKSDWAVIHWVHLWDGSLQSSTAELMLPVAALVTSPRSIDGLSFVDKGIRIIGEYFLARACAVAYGGVELTLFSLATEAVMKTSFTEADLKMPMAQYARESRGGETDVYGDERSQTAWLEFVISQLPVICVTAAIRRGSGLEFAPN
jgi:hypothetical protein